MIQLVVQPLIACQKTDFTYNALGSLTSVTDADAKTWKFEYDDAQNLRYAKDALQTTQAARVTEYQYDALNRVQKTIQPGNRVSVYAYDNNSNLLSTTDPKNQTTALTYTALDDAATVNIDNRIQHTFTYDAEQNLKLVAETRNGSQRTYSRDYDQRNRLTKTTNAFGKSVGFGYDNANNLKTLTDASNRTTTYNYDQKNQLDTVTQSSAVNPTVWGQA